MNDIPYSVLLILPLKENGRLSIPLLEIEVGSSSLISKYSSNASSVCEDVFEISRLNGVSVSL